MIINNIFSPKFLQTIIHSILNSSSPKISYRQSSRDQVHALHRGYRTYRIFPLYISHPSSHNLYGYPHTQRDHIVAESKQSTKDDVLLSHQIDLFQLRPLYNRQQGDQLIRCLEDYSLPKIFSLPYLNLFYCLALVEIFICILLSICHGEEYVKATSNHKNIIGFYRLEYCALYLLEEGFQDNGIVLNCQFSINFLFVNVLILIQCQIGYKSIEMMCTQIHL